ncbi:hypothetical protein SG09_38100 [Bradyrhizobium ottawaense]|uniref:hypothetical protein n=1 Tax=Bradyrhizobium ottawaense TaxID=931866 RepID=UPI00126048FD|nr:hypothetical protein [Bradyrhizobium ottawaense]BBO04460.1 hypothetical protein SG09_38100 [Bradyrhizobium ottawaense]
MKLANTADEYIRMGETAPHADLIYDPESWSRARQEKWGVLRHLSEEALDQFERSMRFKEGCLVSAHGAHLERELDGEVSGFFELFGIGKDLLGSAWPFLCTPRGCVRTATYYCFFHKTGCNNPP